MKKENSIKKILLSSLRGFPLGIALLMIAYVGVYFIAGSETYELEINQLKNVQNFLQQMIGVGLAYYLLNVSFKIMLYISKKEIIDKCKRRSKLLFILVIPTLIIMLVFLILGNEKIFTKNIIMMNTIIYLLMFAILTIVGMIKNIIDSKIIEKINEKLKERNKQNQ